MDKSANFVMENEKTCMLLPQEEQNQIVSKLI